MVRVAVCTAAGATASCMQCKPLFYDSKHNAFLSGLQDLLIFLMLAVVDSHFSSLQQDPEGETR